MVLTYAKLRAYVNTMNTTPARAYRKSPFDHEPESVTWARKRSGLTKSQLASETGLSLSLVSEIESGTRNATPANLLKIAEALNCPVVMLERKRTGGGA